MRCTSTFEITSSPLAPAAKSSLATSTSTVPGAAEAFDEPLSRDSSATTATPTMKNPIPAITSRFDRRTRCPFAPQQFEEWIGTRGHDLDGLCGPFRHGPNGLVRQGWCVGPDDLERRRRGEQPDRPQERC